MDILNLLISWQFLFLSLAISALVYTIRLIIEILFKLEKERIWRELILPIMPIVIGGLFAGFIVDFDYPEMITCLSTKIIFGSVAGLLSAQIYKIIKGTLLGKDKED